MQFNRKENDMKMYKDGQFSDYFIEKNKNIKIITS